MKFIQKFTIYVIIFTTSLSFLSATSMLGNDSQGDLMRIMARSSDLLQQDPARYMSCFHKYIELINYIASSYEEHFKACIDNSILAAAHVDESTIEERYRLVNAVKAVCNLMKNCTERDSVEGILQCYADGGHQHIQTMYDVHVNASKELAVLREKYFRIRNEEYKCTNETKRSYEKASADKYVSFNDCILGNSDIFIEQISTTTEKKISTTTEKKISTVTEKKMSTTTEKKLSPSFRTLGSQDPNDELSSEDGPSEEDIAEETD